MSPKGKSSRLLQRSKRKGCLAQGKAFLQPKRLCSPVIIKVSNQNRSSKLQRPGEPRYHQSEDHRAVRSCEVAPSSRQSGDPYGLRAACLSLFLQCIRRRACREATSSRIIEPAAPQSDNNDNRKHTTISQHQPTPG